MLNGQTLSSHTGKTSSVPKFELQEETSHRGPLVCLRNTQADPPRINVGYSRE